MSHKIIKPDLDLVLRDLPFWNVGKSFAVFICQWTSIMADMGCHVIGCVLNL